MGYRAGRMSEDIRRIISGKMRDLKDPRIHGGEMLTVEAVKGFESATGYLKREISNVLKLKKCPELKFVADNSIEHSAEITRKLREIIKEEPSDEDTEDGSEDIEDKEDTEDMQ